MNTKIEQRNPMELKPLPIVKGMVRWAQDSKEFEAFKTDIRENGIKEPLLITVDGQVIDGWTRCLAARAWELETVSCVVVPPDEVKETVLRKLILRRNLNKGQQAYTIEPFLQDVKDEKRRRRLQNLAKGQQTPEEVLSLAKTESWVEICGFSAELLKQATWLHKTFKDYPEMRDEWEPKILSMDSPIGLGAAKAGITQQLEAVENGRKFDPRNSQQLDLFKNTFVRDFSNRFEYWNTLPAADKKKAVHAIEAQASTMTRAECEAAAEVLRDIAKIYATAAKQSAVEGSEQRQ